MANCLALFEEFWAPAKSPLAHFPLTWAAKTIEATPNGRQQNRVVRIDQTR